MNSNAWWLVVALGVLYFVTRVVRWELRLQERRKLDETRRMIDERIAQKREGQRNYLGMHRPRRPHELRVNGSSEKE